MKRTRSTWILSMLLMASCAAAPQNTSTPSPAILITSAQTATPTIQTTQTNPPHPTPTETILPTLTSTPTPPPSLCSPLVDITLQELPEILTNPFDEPLPGRDDGHHGADFAYYSRGPHKGMLGLPVMSMLNGRVAAVILDKPPYGYAILVESPLQNLLAVRPALADFLPTPAPTIIPDSRLTCPTPEIPPPWPDTKASVYILYAHLEKPPSLLPGDQVDCGQIIGQVGTSGMSVNPHLHLEMRLGPAEATFSSMGHYGAVSQSEMTQYCLWRASQWFQMFDPMLLLK